MREILFRAKSKVRGDWVEGCLVRRYNGYVGIDRPHPDLCFELIQVEPETVGQYTGLKDKNGTRIFEGDIVGAKHPEQKKAVPCLVKYGEYEDEDGRVDCRYLGFCLEVFDKCCSILTPLSDGIEYEVIGNVHDGGAYD